MKNHFEAERITMPTAAEVNRLTGIFGGDLSPLGAIHTLAPGYVTSDWEIDTPVNPDKHLLERSLRIGPAEITMDFGQNMFFLKWFAALPPFMFPKPNVQNYLDFRDFAFEEFPQMLWSHAVGDDIPNLNYLAHSTVRVQYRGKAASSRYDLGKEKDRISFELDFIDRSEKIKAISIEGRTDADHDKPGYFHLRLDYRGANDPQTKVSLGFMLDDFGLGAFNPEVVGWAIETNEHVDRIEDPIVAACNLIEAMDPTLQAQIEIAKAKKGLL